MEVKPTSRVRRADAEYVSSEIDGELVFMHIERGEFFGLRGTGLVTWKLIDEGGAWTLASAIVASLCKRFEVDAQTCLEDLAVLFDDLTTAGLAEVVP